MSAHEGNLRAWRTHLSDDWKSGIDSSSFPAQTMRVAATLHTGRQHSRRRCLQAQLSAVKKRQQRRVTVGLLDAPVKWLVSVRKYVKFSNADHEGGSGPADRGAALTMKVLSRRAES